MPFDMLVTTPAATLAGPGRVEGWRDELSCKAHGGSQHRSYREVGEREGRVAELVVPKRAASGAAEKLR